MHKIESYTHPDPDLSLQADVFMAARNSHLGERPFYWVRVWYTDTKSTVTQSRHDDFGEANAIAKRATHNG